MGNYKRLLIFCESIIQRLIKYKEMKIIARNIFIISILLTMIISTCKKEDKYNWKNVEPGKQLITGVDTIKGNEVSTYEFLAIPRGDSKYEWKVLSGPVTIEVDDKDKDPLKYRPFRALISANSAVDTNAIIAVTETTWGGKIGEPDTFYIKILCYVPFDINQLIGNGQFTETRSGFAPQNVSLFKIVGDSMVIDSNFIQIENGVVTYILSRDPLESIKIVSDTFDYGTSEGFDGRTLVMGNGNYSVCKRSFNIHYFLVAAANSDTIENGIVNYTPK
jgi:hypothetical protein